GIRLIFARNAFRVRDVGEFQVELPTSDLTKRGTVGSGSLLLRTNEYSAALISRAAVDGHSATASGNFIPAREPKWTRSRVILVGYLAVGAMLGVAAVCVIDRRLRRDDLR